MENTARTVTMRRVPFTIQDIVHFAILHRNKGRRKVFVDWTREQICRAVQMAISWNGFAFATNERGTAISAFVLARPDHDKKTLHVAHCLGETGALKKLMKCYRQMYDGYKITARRDGKPVEYKTDRLVQLVENN